MSDDTYIKDHPAFPSAMKKAAKGEIVDWSHDTASGSWQVSTPAKITMGVNEMVVMTMKTKRDKQ